MQFFLLGLLVLGGMGLTVQQAINSRLRVGVESPVLSALISFLVGAAVLAVLSACGVLGRGKLTGLGILPWWAWTGGLLGAFYVTLAVVGVRAVGGGDGDCVRGAGAGVDGSAAGRDRLAGRPESAAQSASDCRGAAGAGGRPVGAVETIESAVTEMPLPP